MICVHTHMLWGRGLRRGVQACVRSSWGGVYLIIVECVCVCVCMYVHAHTYVMRKRGARTKCLCICMYVYVNIRTHLHRWALDDKQSGCVYSCMYFKCMYTNTHVSTGRWLGDCFVPSLHTYIHTHTHQKPLDFLHSYHHPCIHTYTHTHRWAPDAGLATVSYTQTPTTDSTTASAVKCKLCITWTSVCICSGIWQKKTGMCTYMCAHIS